VLLIGLDLHPRKKSAIEGSMPGRGCTAYSIVGIDLPIHILLVCSVYCKVDSVEMSRVEVEIFEFYLRYRVLFVITLKMTDD
jgi:hypothetical protein